MSSFVYNNAALKLLNGVWDLPAASAAGELRIMLVTSSYVPDKDHVLVNAGAGLSSAKPLANEISATNYTGGYGGAGRKQVTLTFATQNASDRSVAAISQPLWTSLGGGVNDTIRGAVMYVFDTDDSVSELLAYFDLPGSGSGYTTNGSDFLLQFAALVDGGNLRLNC